MIAKFRHPGIVAVHAAGEADGLLYYVMDRVEGETLRDRLRRERRSSVSMMPAASLPTWPWRSMPPRVPAWCIAT